MTNENSVVCKVTMVVNGHRVSTCFGGLDILTDGDIVDLVVRDTHRKVNQLGKDLKDKLAG